MRRCKRGMREADCAQFLAGGALKCLPKLGDGILPFSWSIRRWRYKAPYRTWPGRVGAKARDDVDMKLWHLVTESRRVDLVRPEDLLERGGCPATLFYHDYPVGTGELIYLAYIASLRHEYQPGIGAIVHEQGEAQIKRANLDAVSCKCRVEFKHRLDGDAPARRRRDPVPL